MFYNLDLDRVQSVDENCLDASILASTSYGPENKESRRMMAVVDNAEAARTALAWAMHNVIRSGDRLTLIHVHPTASRDRTRRLRRLKGFQLALSFKDICDLNSEVKVEIVVVEGEEGPTIVSFAKKLGATALILGQHKRGLFGRMLGKKDTPEYCIKNSECLVLAVSHKSRKMDVSMHTKTASKIKILRYY